MKEFYNSPEATLIYFAPAENIATGSVIDWDGSVVPGSKPSATYNPTYDLESPI